MDILRIIKIKHFYGELENLTPEEKLFFELHENLHQYSHDTLCNDNQIWVVSYDFEAGYFWYDYDNFYLFFKQAFNIDVKHFNDLCESILKKHLDCNGLKPFMWWNYKIHY